MRITPLLVADLALACSSSEKTLSPAELCDELVPAVCATSATCCGDPAFSYRDCEIFAQELCLSLVTAIQNGVVIYDDAKGYQCVQQIEALAPSCPAAAAGDLTPWLTAAPACLAAAAGTLPEGESCGGFFFACKPGLECPFATGVCTRPRNVSESCVGGLPCVSGAWCNPATGACEAYVAIGSLCPAGATCVPEAYCNAGTCAARKLGGEDCTSGDECLSKDCQTTCTHPDNPWCGLFVP